MKRFDFAIFGSGFGGSIMAMILRRLGYSVLMLERGSHPRFAIGESSTPFANLLLERIAEEFDLPFLHGLSEWGRWQKHFPELPCGLKRGFTFYHHEPGKSVDFEDRSSQLLVAASPNDQVADTHWYRPALDHFLVAKAEELGVVYIDRVTINGCSRQEGWRLCFDANGQNQEITTRFVIDATGATGFLSSLLEIPSERFSTMPETHTVYAHFKNVKRTPGLADPYPPDDAALHHVFAEGWVWVLHFNNGITSAGAALKSTATHEKPEQAWRSLLDRLPTLRNQFADAVPVTPFYELLQLSFRRSRVAAEDWALLPSAAGFVDPLLSTGFALTLLGIRRLGTLLKDSPKLRPEGAAEYERETLKDLDATADLVSALYAKMHSFGEFAALSLLYFAALSFTESAWRLDRQELAEGFFLRNDARFTAARSEICSAARRGEKIDTAKVAAEIEPWDVAGLGNLTRGNRYPVLFEDLVRGRHKLGATESEVRALLAKLGV